MVTDRYPFMLPPPPEQLSGTVGSGVDSTPIGKTLYVSGMYETRHLFGLKRADRNRHAYILGKSGMGKTCFMENLIRSDIESGQGVAVVDPHGDLVKGLMQCIPNERVNDVVYIDPTLPSYTISFNPFASVPAHMRQHVCQSLIEVFRKQFQSSWSPRMEHLFRFATLAMLEYEQGTLYGILQIITDSKYRQMVIENINDEMTRRFFAVEFAGFSQKYEQEAITPLANRLGAFFADPLLREIFSQSENKIHIPDILSKGKILFINMSKGVLGEQNASLLGSFFLTMIEQGALARASEETDKRKSFYLYADEFQNVATESFISLFSESRKYAINITIANQYLSQIPKTLMDAVLGNTGNMVVFRLGGEDAQRIAMEFQPELSPADFLNLGLGEYYIKMSTDGQTLRPFCATSLQVEAFSHSENAERIIDNNKRMFASSDQEDRAGSKDRESYSQEELPAPL
ncbi:type IV secretion system DNA-binding domain-containing protein [Candidatus Nomurabacteria bacterium]|nr:type IV secretion system DNA-binding domain-containing protein [Candidatus Nomurabacteria bacterium]